MMTLFLKTLPIELYREIQPYCQSLDYWHWLSSNQEIFQFVKYQTISFKIPLLKYPELYSKLIQKIRKLFSFDSSLFFLYPITTTTAR